MEHVSVAVRRRFGQLVGALLVLSSIVACSSTADERQNPSVPDEKINTTLAVIIAPSPVVLPPGNWNSRQFDNPDLHAVFILQDPNIPFGEIGNNPDTVLYQQAAVVCGDLDRFSVVAALTSLLSNFDYTATDTGLLVRESVQVFCRDRLPLLMQAAADRGIVASTGGASPSSAAASTSSAPPTTAPSGASPEDLPAQETLDLAVAAVEHPGLSICGGMFVSEIIESADVRDTGHDQYFVSTTCDMATGSTPNELALYESLAGTLKRTALLFDATSQSYNFNGKVEVQGRQAVAQLVVPFTQGSELATQTFTFTATSFTAGPFLSI